MCIPSFHPTTKMSTSEVLYHVEKAAADESGLQISRAYLPVFASEVDGLHNLLLSFLLPISATNSPPSATLCDMG